MAVAGVCDPNRDKRVASDDAVAGEETWEGRGNYSTEDFSAMTGECRHAADSSYLASNSTTTQRRKSKCASKLLTRKVQS